MRYAILMILLTLSSVSCGPPPVASPSALPPQPVRFESKASKGDGSRMFVYSWPAEVAAEPNLASFLLRERTRLLAEQEAEWDAALRDAPAGCVSCQMRELRKEWSVLGDVPAFLSLAADIYQYTGGAHGMSHRQSLVWDRAAGEPREAIDLFVSPAVLQDAIGPALCAALNAERATRRGMPASRTNREWPNQCPALDEASVLVASSQGKTFDRIAIYFGPYVAGPYAEGAYELVFPVDAAITSAVKPAFRTAFAAPR